jgi:hypothetical protein
MQKLIVFILIDPVFETIDFFFEFCEKLAKKTSLVKTKEQGEKETEMLEKPQLKIGTQAKFGHLNGLPS